MTEKKYHRNVSLEVALEVVSELKYGYRDTLRCLVGDETYDKLCILGYITQGTSITENNSSKRVWQVTDKIKFVESIKAPLTTEEIKKGKVLSKMGFWGD